MLFVKASREGGCCGRGGQGVLGEAKSGSFSVKSLYPILEAISIDLFQINFMWNVWVPPKVSIFA